MGKYRKVDPRVWNDAKFRNLSDRAKLAFFFLLTHPHMTPLGAMRQTIPGLAAELGWSEKAFREAFGEALSKGMAKHDEKAAMIWLPKFMRYNLPESPNVLRSWRHGADTLPECDLFFVMIQEVKALSEGMGEGFKKAFAEAFPEARRQPSPNQEQEQEQEQEHETTPAPSKANGADQADCFLALPTTSGVPFPVTEDMITHWEGLYPAVDVRQALRSMLGWLDANPANRKTSRGMKRFITNWLNREQNRAPRQQAGQAQPDEPWYKRATNIK